MHGQVEKGNLVGVEGNLVDSITLRALRHIAGYGKRTSMSLRYAKLAEMEKKDLEQRLAQALEDLQVSC